MKSTFSRYIVCLALFSFNGSYAEVYKTVDENGQVTYTDQPPANARAEKVELHPSNVQPAVKPQAIKKKPRSASFSDNTQLNIRLSSPQPEERFGPTIKSVSVQAQLSRDLNDNELIVFYHNGGAIGEASKSKSRRVRLGVTTRGQRTFNAEVVDARTGKVLARSQAVTIYVIRP